MPIGGLFQAAAECAWLSRSPVIWFQVSWPVSECVPVGSRVELMLGWPEMLVTRIVDGTEP